eukprot:1763979-Rhodomonas_salina.1
MRECACLSGRGRGGGGGLRDEGGGMGGADLPPIDPAIAAEAEIAAAEKEQGLPLQVMPAARARARG